MSTITEAEACLSDKRGGISELSQMKSLMKEKWASLPEDVDPSEKAAFEGESHEDGAQEKPNP